MAQVVHFVCDSYEGNPSIKDPEHERRGETDSDYTITGPEQKQPAKFQ